MAIYHASCTPVGRSAGRSSVAAAAYRAGCELVDERTGLVHDYTRRGGVVSSLILAPHGLNLDRGQLWNAAEVAEVRSDGRTAREWVIALPAELDEAQRKAAATEYASWLVKRFGVAADVAIHAPGAEGDSRNHHAHILLTTRQMLADGTFGDKCEIEWQGTRLKKSGRPSSKAMISEARISWETIANAALERAGRPERIDHRSHQDRDLDEVPTIHLGWIASQMERRGAHSELGNINRAAAAESARIVSIKTQLAEVHQIEEARARRDAPALKAKADADRRIALGAEIAKERSLVDILPSNYATDELRAARAALATLERRRADTARRTEDAVRSAESWRKANPIRAWLRVFDKALVGLEAVKHEIVGEAELAQSLVRKASEEMTWVQRRSQHAWEMENFARKARLFDLEAELAKLEVHRPRQAVVGLDLEVRPRPESDSDHGYSP